MTGGIIILGGVISWAWWLDHQPWVRLRRNSPAVVGEETTQHPTSCLNDSRQAYEETHS